MLVYVFRISETSSSKFDSIIVQQTMILGTLEYKSQILGLSY